jgi:hypothetical protein
MSQPTSPPPPATGTIDVGPPSGIPPGHPGATRPVDANIARLREELAATTERPRKARLSYEIGEAQERGGDEPGAAREYLAAFNADPTFREPLEGLVRLLERRRSVKNLGKLLDALVRASATPDEKARALLMRAAHQEDTVHDLEAAKTDTIDATTAGARSAETALAWLMLEILAAKTGNASLRTEALGERAKHAGDSTWKALLLLDLGRLASAAGEATRALSLFDQSRSLESGASFTAARAAARLIRSDPGAPGSDEAKERLRAYAATLEAQAELIRQARASAQRGDDLGVPMWTRDTTHMVDAWLRAAEAHRLAGQIAAAAGVLDRALGELGNTSTDSAGIIETALVNERIRVAEQMGDTALAAELSQKRIANEQDKGVAAALAMRVAEHAASEGDAVRALDAISLAIAKDPACIPARALQLDLLADSGDSGTFATELESFATQFASKEARGRVFLLAAFVWGMLAGDVARARASLAKAVECTIPASTAARLARSMAAVRSDAVWLEEATRSLIEDGAGPNELASLRFEIIRSKLARGDLEGARQAIGELADAPRGAWLARAIEAFVPGAADAARVRQAPADLAAATPDADRAFAASIIAAMRDHDAGDLEATKKRLRALAAADPASVLVTAYLADVERASGALAKAAEVLTTCAVATTDPELRTAFHLEAGFDRWRAGDKAGAVASFEEALAGSAVNGQNAVAWASLATASDDAAGRRRSLERALEAGEDENVVQLGRFATELVGGDPDEATAALIALERRADGNLRVAAALARLGWSQGAADWDAQRASVARIGALGSAASAVAAAEQLRLARDGDPEAGVQAAREWFDAGGGVPAALEWIAASLGRPEEESGARRRAADAFDGPARESMLASAALLGLASRPDTTDVHFVDGDSVAVRLANLELARPGIDPRRRAKALVALGDALGDDVQIDALGLAGWSLLATGDLENAAKAFSQATRARADDICAWEGLRAAADALADKPRRAEAAEELGARCLDATRGAAFWEEAALLWLDLGEGERAELALDKSFTRDPSRPVAFDKLFRRVRERKDADYLLDLIERRLDVSDDAKEMVKLYWERSRVLRDKGDVDGALVALENVTMVEPDHVGALALQGEIFIRRGEYDRAAESLGRLATIETAPPKNRVTAGVAAVDLYENKLDRFDKALEVLLVLHRAKLSSLPVRERLARAAARSGSWQEAANILEELMFERPEPAGRIEAARLALAIHRDRLSDPQGATAAVIKLLEESPAHGDAVDLLFVIELDPPVRKRLLEGARTGLVAALQEKPADGPNASRLAKVARALGDSALEQIALSATASLGAGDGEGQVLFAQLAQKKPRAPQIALTDANMRSINAPGDSGPLVELFSALGPTLAEALGPSLVALGVTKRDRVDPRSGLALRNEVAAWAGAFGVQEFELYVGGKDPMAVQGVPGEPPSLVVGPGINAPLTAPLRGRVARELYAIARGTTVLRSRDTTTVAAIVVAACRLAEVPFDSPAYAVLAEIEKQISKAIARRTRKLLADICQRVSASRVDAQAWAKRGLASLDRVQALAAGDVTPVLADVLGAADGRLSAVALADPRAAELLRFVLSPHYLELRRALGLETT